VSNAAAVPGDDLEYTMSADPGFTAPGGPFSAAPGAGYDHTITMDTSTVGAKGGDLIISSNDLDSPTWDVALSGTVVDHATPSLDALSVVLTDTVDFGSHDIGTFGTESFYVHNKDYGGLEALLDVHDVAIGGGEGRFSFVGGFTPQLVGETPAYYELQFDDTGASLNTLYEAALTIATRDDPSVSGGTDLSELTLHLSAFVTDGTSVPEDEILALALSPGSPNPFTDRTSLSLALPEASSAAVEIYDVSGRLVTMLVDGVLSAGENAVVWDGRDAQGRPAATGIYFCRAQVGEWHEARKVVLLR
jgi:hypothetical protein